MVVGNLQGLGSQVGSRERAGTARNLHEVNKIQRGGVRKLITVTLPWPR